MDIFFNELGTRPIATFVINYKTTARRAELFRPIKSGKIGRKEKSLCLPREILFRRCSLLLTRSKSTCEVFTPIAVCHISLGCLRLPREIFTTCRAFYNSAMSTVAANDSSTFRSVTYFTGVVNMFSNECSECAVSPLYFSASRPEGPLTIRVFK